MSFLTKLLLSTALVCLVCSTVPAKSETIAGTSTGQINIINGPVFSDPDGEKILDICAKHVHLEGSLLARDQGWEACTEFAQDYINRFQSAIASRTYTGNSAYTVFGNSSSTTGYITFPALGMSNSHPNDLDKAFEICLKHGDFFGSVFSNSKREAVERSGTWKWEAGYAESCQKIVNLHDAGGDKDLAFVKRTATEIKP